MKGVLKAMEAQRRRNESEVRQMINTVEQEQAMALKARQKAEKEAMRKRMIELQMEQKKREEEEKMEMARQRRDANLRAAELRMEENRKLGEAKMRQAELKMMTIEQKRAQERELNRIHAEQKALQVQMAYERAQQSVEERRRELLAREQDAAYRQQRREVQNHARSILKREEEHEREAKRREALERAEDHLHFRCQQIQRKVDAKMLRVEHMENQKQEMLEDLQRMRKDMDIQQARLRHSIEQMRLTGVMEIPKEILRAPYTPRAHVPAYAARAEGGGYGGEHSAGRPSIARPGSSRGRSASASRERPRSASHEAPRQVFRKVSPGEHRHRGGGSPYYGTPESATSSRARPSSAPRRRHTPPGSGGSGAGGGGWSGGGGYAGGGAGGLSPESDRREDALRRMLEREENKERERDRILHMVTDPKEKQRLHKLFAIERERAKEAILRLSS